jgi:hypothetical protein
MAVEIPIISEFDGKGVKKAIKEFQQLEGAGAKANFALKKAAMASTVAFAGLAAGISLATKAAMEDAQAQTQLATALKNTTGATDAQIASSEQYISTLSRATGVADDQLRPALAALVRGTKDINQAQIVRNSMNEATESLGAAFLPVLESILPVIQRFADWAGKNTETLVGLTYAIGITTAAVIALNFAMSINPWVLAVTYTLLATTALFKFSDALKNSESMVGRLIYKLRYLIAPLLAVIDAYNAIARITGLPQLTPDSISLPGIPSAAPTLGPPAAVTGGANRLVPSLPSIPSISPAGVSGSRSGGRSGGMALSDGGGSGPSAASLGLALDLSNYQPPADFLAGYDPFAGMGFTINVNGGLATSAEIGNAVVDAIKQYTNVSGPADIAIR